MDELIRDIFARIVKEKSLAGEEVEVLAKPLTPEEAIGNPEERDYPLLKGKERLMQANFKGFLGQAFTDMYGNYQGKLSEIIKMELRNNFRRAIFTSTLNAVMRYLGLVEKTIHCKDREPQECSWELVSYLRKDYGPSKKIALVGFQPRMVEALAKEFPLKVTDMDKENMGKDKFGIKIYGPEKTEEHLKWCDLALVTGTTIVNGTINQFKVLKPVIFYGVTISGVAKLLGLNHFCPYGS